MKIYCMYKGQRCEVFQYRSDFSHIQVKFPSGETERTHKSKVDLCGWRNDRPKIERNGEFE